MHAPRSRIPCDRTEVRTSEKAYDALHGQALAAFRRCLRVLPAVTSELGMGRVRRGWRDGARCRQFFTRQAYYRRLFARPARSLSMFITRPPSPSPSPSPPSQPWPQSPPNLPISAIPYLPRASPRLPQYPERDRLLRLCLLSKPPLWTIRLSSS